MNKLIFPFLFIACLFLTRCSVNFDTEVPSFIKNARIVENGETLSPGSLVHLEGSGYRETDNVILNFFWQTGDKILPEGTIKGSNQCIRGDI